jgi:CubicO group peptidase (beta-lactamase class C family)
LADPARQAIRIRHLLTMSAGLDWTEPSPVRRVTSSDETGLTYRRTAYPYVFARPVTAPPGQVFTYSGGLTAVLAEIMVRATGRLLREIAAAELFTPLGITSWEWVGNLFGTPLAAAGLRLRPRDLLKIGAMMLNEGTWQGRQIVPAVWIAESTAPHIPAEPLGAYGYQWWATATPWRGHSLPTATAIGNGGQRLTLVPALGVAIAITAGDYNSPAINRALDETLKTLVATIKP